MGCGGQLAKKTPPGVEIVQWRGFTKTNRLIEPTMEKPHRDWKSFLPGFVRRVTQCDSAPQDRQSRSIIHRHRRGRIELDNGYVKEMNTGRSCMEETSEEAKIAIEVESLKKRKITEIKTTVPLRWKNFDDRRSAQRQWRQKKQSKERKTGRIVKRFASVKEDKQVGISKVPTDEDVGKGEDKKDKPKWSQNATAQRREKETEREREEESKRSEGRDKLHSKMRKLSFDVESKPKISGKPKKIQGYSQLETSLLAMFDTPESCFPKSPVKNILLSRHLTVLTYWKRFNTQGAFSEEHHRPFSRISSSNIFLKTLFVLPRGRKKERGQSFPGGGDHEAKNIKHKLKKNSRV
ncbi:hypothetical protein RUM44_000141 [Polyplax serrata]|uniref:Uncharacterized protein n=1 Tax=Polyplax serrata TaxID=468196 RepID=A0ABR1B4N3_POLSC